MTTRVPSSSSLPTPPVLQETPSSDKERIDPGPWELLCAVTSSEPQKAVAERLGISPQYLCDVLKGRREISAELARRIGYERVVSFLKAPRPVEPQASEQETPDPSRAETERLTVARTLLADADAVEAHMAPEVGGGTVADYMRRAASLLMPAPKPETPQGLTNDEIIVIREAVRRLDCGVHHCRYCAAKSPEWQHSRSCPYMRSVEVADQARAILDRLQATPPQPDLRTWVQHKDDCTFRQCVTCGHHEGSHLDFEDGRCHNVKRPFESERCDCKKFVSKGCSCGLDAALHGQRPSPEEHKERTGDANGQTA